MITEAEKKAWSARAGQAVHEAAEKAIEQVRKEAAREGVGMGFAMSVELAFWGTNQKGEFDFDNEADARWLHELGVSHE